MSDQDQYDGTAAPLWWHVYGHVVPEGDFAGCWRMAILGEASIGPGETTLTGETPETTLIDGMPWLGSLDHEPTDDEKNALTPEAFRD